MIRVTVELVPFGFEENKRHLGTAEIWNDATGTLDVGNYKYRLSKWGRPDVNWKEGKVKGFPRKSRGAWDLLYLVLRDAVASRNKDISPAVDNVKEGT
jgi:hypothetical protein